METYFYDIWVDEKNVDIWEVRADTVAQADRMIQEMLDTLTHFAHSGTHEYRYQLRNHAG